MATEVSTLDFHVTSECSQECPYCWGPQGYDPPVDTQTALAIITRVREIGARRIVFTGGDPARRPDLPALVRHAKEVGLEVALSTTGDALTPELLRELAPYLDLVSLPLDGAREEVSAHTKKPGHFAAVMQALDLLRGYPSIDVKLCTPVTRHNLGDVGNIVRLAEEYARSTGARVFYNVFQTFPRSMSSPRWEELVVSDEEFAALERELGSGEKVHVNFLSHATLDRLYAMVFPDGSLVVASGPDYFSYGPFLAIEDVGAVLAASPFDAARNRQHSLAWHKSSAPV